MNKKYLFIFFFLIIQIKASKVYSQINLDEKEYYIWFDNVVGNGNSGIYNGTLFVEKYITEPNNHRFFLDNTYKLGNLIYDNQMYYNVYLKYDVHEDELIAKLPYQSNHLFLKLIKSKIKSFEVVNEKVDFSSKNHLFVNSFFNKNIINKSFNGFYEVLSKLNTSTLLKKNYKERTETISNNLVFSKFSNRDYFAILKGDNFFIINSKKDVIRIFPKQKRYISVFYRRNRKLFKINETIFYKNLFRDIYKSISKTESK